MNRTLFGIASLAAATGVCTACSSSNGGGPADSGGSSDSTTLNAPNDQYVGEASSDASMAGGYRGSAGTPMASCQTSGPGLTNCGANSENCCTSLEVPGGTYDRTYDFTDAGTLELSADGGTGEADPATVSSFRLDKYLATVGRFRQFVNSVLPPDGGVGWLPEAGSGKHTHLNGGKGLNATGGGYEPGWVAADDSNIAPTNANLACDPSFATWTNTAGSQENLPMNCVNWYEAYAFCIWDGGFLPSEAEWEYAAAGGNQEREYPWGSTAPGTACPGKGCQYAIYNCDYPNGPGPDGGFGTCTGMANIAPVGTATLGAGLWGQLDLAGDVNGWNLDWYALYIDPCTDCADVAQSSAGRVFRGGYFSYGASLLLPPLRYDLDPSTRSDLIGFRCSRTP
jgi:formylglycine-generating enzyme